MIPLQIPFPGGPEFLILGAIYVILPFVMAYWIYTDADRRGDESAALWAIGVGALTYLTFFGGVLAFVVYVWQRE